MWGSVPPHVYIRPYKALPNCLLKLTSGPCNDFPPPFREFINDALGSQICYAESIHLDIFVAANSFRTHLTCFLGTWQNDKNWSIWELNVPVLEYWDKKTLSLTVPAILHVYWFSNVAIPNHFFRLRIFIFIRDGFWFYFFLQKSLNILNIVNLIFTPLRYSNNTLFPLQYGKFLLVFSTSKLLWSNSKCFGSCGRKSGSWSGTETEF